MGDLIRQSSLFPFLDAEVGPAPPVEPEPEAAPGRSLRRKYLINTLNHLNFCGAAVDVVFQHREYAHLRTLKAIPEPCSSERCDFIWSDSTVAPARLEGYRLESIRIEQEGERILIYPEESIQGSGGISVELPKTAVVRDVDPGATEGSQGIEACLLQSGIRLQGELVSFSDTRCVAAFREDSAARWIEEANEVYLELEKENESIYSGSCRIDSSFTSQGRRCYALILPTDAAQRYIARHYRSSRSSFQMSPRCRFFHPLSGRSIERRILELSGSGFSYDEESGSSRLPVGIIIPELELHFPEYSAITVVAQVIHRTTNEGKTHYGFCLLDIEPQDHLIVLSLVHQSFNVHASLCKKVDLDRLWRFFFESGFIYPNKYALLKEQKQKIRLSFERLYSRRNNLARHFIYQKEDTILGHLSMVRFYERTWLLHHHASSGRKGENAGIHVLNQVGSYVNDSCRFEKMNLEYLMCYYRPENHFPNRIFGGLAEYTGNKKTCSVDEVAYYRSPSTVPPTKSPLWELAVPSEDEYTLAALHYEEQSGGLLFEALNLPPYARPESSNAGVLAAYEELGIRRAVRVRVLRHNGRLAAFFIVSVSDPGINLSELTNSITAIVIRRELVSRELFEEAVSSLVEEMENPGIPVLVFPRKAADSLGIPYEKCYHLWVMDTGIGDTYFEHIQSILRTVQS